MAGERRDIVGLRRGRRLPQRWTGLLALAAVLALAPAPGAPADVPAAPAAARTEVPKPANPPVRALLAQAFGALDAGDFEAAKAVTARLDDPVLAQALTWFRLIERRSGGDYSAYTHFLAEHPDWPGQQRLRHRAEGLMPADLPAAQVRAVFSAHPPVSAYGAERFADALLAAGEDAAARDLLRQAWRDKRFPFADEQRFAARYGHLLSPDLHAARLERLLWSGDYTAAARQARRVDPGRRALARARIMLARTAPGVDAAIAAVPAELRDHPGLLFERARWRMRKGRHAGVVELLDPPRAQVPEPARWWPMRRWAARRALDAGDISVAYRIAAGHGLAAGLGFAEGEWLAGWIALRWLREPATALPHFTRLHAGVTTPVSRARGAYWAGRAAEAARRDTDARVWYETAARHLTTYYGQLAAARLSADFFLALPRAPAPSQVAQRAFAADEIVRAIRHLAAHGHAERIDPLFRHLIAAARTRARAQLVADLAVSAGRPDLAVRTARGARRAGMILPDHLYPVRDLPQAQSRDGDREALVLAIVRQESGFDPNAVSPAGARGMMQLMPATARHVANSLDLDPSRHSLNDPAYNLLLGSAYLDRLVARYDGSLLLAVTAYNAGPGRVGSWLKRYGDPRAAHIDPVDWVETLPFAETRNYIQRVLEGLIIYRHRRAPTRLAVALDGRLEIAPARAAAPELHREF